MAPRKPPITGAEEQRIIELHGEGLSRNAIAKAVDRGAASVSAVCAKHGLRFERTDQLIKATEVARADVQARTAVARIKEMDILEFEQEKVLAVQEGRALFKARMKGAQGTEHIKELDFIPAEEVQKLATARGSMQATIARMAPKDDGDTARVVSVLDRVIRQLGVPDE